MNRTMVQAVAVTLATQTLAAIAIIAPAVLAPAAAVDLGVAPQAIGIFVAAAYLLAMLSGLAIGGLIAGLGSLRVCQLALVLCALGLVAGAPGWATLVPVAAILIGYGYGLVTPTSSHILAAATPRPMMALIFSIKQTGVPIGGAIAGAVAPPLALAIGWQWTLAVLAGACVVAAVAMQPMRARFAAKPREGEGSRRIPRAPRRSLARIGAPVRLVLATPALRDLAVSSFVFAQVQLVVITYLVPFLNLGLGLSLVTAGLIYSAAHAAGVVGRVVWGAIADRLLAPRIVLALLGVGSAACGLATAAATPTWPVGALVALGAAYGASAVGWNGVYLAEVARRAPEGQVGAATGGTQFFTFFGALSGPPAFAALVWATGGYQWGFAAFAVLPLAVGVRLIAAGRPAAGAGARA
ncbi:MAG: MFS transporter [Burkholderiales bacterium]|nr:MFS transporter [Burkholderiales bacterium]